MYILCPNVLEYIPANKYFDMTDLINDLQKENFKIGVYPISGKSWIDVGQWGEYKNSLKLLKNI